MSVVRLLLVLVQALTGFDCYACGCYCVCMCTHMRGCVCSYCLWLQLCKYRKSHVAISKFRGQKNSSEGTQERHAQQPASDFVQVLLILIQHGANGLNLLEAEHVILVEPLLNPAAEAQAISRVHRIGQKNRTLVHRFIVCPALYSRQGIEYLSEYTHTQHTLVHPLTVFARVDAQRSGN